MDEHAAAASLPILVPADTTLRLRLYLQAPHGALPGPVLFQLKATDRESGHDTRQSTYSTPEGNGQ